MNWKHKISRFLIDDSEKVLFLINIIDRLDEVTQFLSETLQNGARHHLIVLFNIENAQSFREINLNTKLSEDYLVKDDYENIDNYVFEGLSKSWYLYKDITSYQGIPLGKMFEYEFQKYLIPRIKNLEILQKVVEKENIQKIIVIDDSYELGGIVSLYADFIKIPILVISFSKVKNAFSKLNLKVKSKLSAFFSNFLDRLSFKRCIKNNDNIDLVLIDTKFYKYFKHRDNEVSFIPCPLEKGLSIRLNLIKQGLSYLPFCFTKNRCCHKNRAIYKKSWKELSSAKEFRDIFKYKSISIWAIVQEKLNDFFFENIPRIIMNINILDRVIKVKKIKLAVLRNDVKELERTIVLWLRLFKIPSLVIQHGVLAESNGHNILLADKFAAWGRASVDWYKKLENSSERFEITGNPRFDMLVNWKPKISKQELCKQLNLNINKGIILFVTQQINKFSSFWTNDLFWVMADKILTAMREFPDKQLIVKVDPYEDIRPYRERIRASCNKDAIAIKDFDIYTLIFVSELVITLDSTVGLEAMVFDKPLITFNLTRRQDRVAYSEKGAALGVYKEEDLAPTIKRALSGQETIVQLKMGRSRFLEEYAYAIDGKARQRILNIIEHYP